MLQQEFAKPAPNTQAILGDLGDMINNLKDALSAAPTTPADFRANILTMIDDAMGMSNAVQNFDDATAEKKLGDLIADLPNFAQDCGS